MGLRCCEGCREGSCVEGGEGSVEGGHGTGIKDVDRDFSRDDDSWPLGE